uniref:CHHC U11-48K-type domain-containing protein n=1 Tax=Plectus sambesii TaxID=2011161 RepID=A0A914XHS6_9BILA
MALDTESTNKIQCSHNGCGQLLHSYYYEEHVALHRLELDSALRIGDKKPEHEMAFCPYNACHVVPQAELEKHTATCPDKRRYLMIHSFLTSSRSATATPTYPPPSLPTSF